MAFSLKPKKRSLETYNMPLSTLKSSPQIVGLKFETRSPIVVLI